MKYSQRALYRGLHKESLEPRWPYGFREWPPDSFDWIVDLGANCGYVTVALRMFFPSAKIIAVEPQPNNYACLKENTFGLRIETLEAAIADVPNVRLSIDCRYGCNTTVGVARRPESEIDVPGIRLSELFQQFDIQGRIAIKMDMEGAEELFLRDPIESDILRQCSYLACEVHQGARRYYDWLASLGELRQWHDRGRVGYAEVLIR